MRFWTVALLGVGGCMSVLPPTPEQLLNTARLQLADACYEADGVTPRKDLTTLERITCADQYKRLWEEPDEVYCLPSLEVDRHVRESELARHPDSEETPTVPPTDGEP